MQDERFEKLFSKLVPSMGNSKTIEGEILRAINKVSYRYFNDGDVYMYGYGAETCGSAATFLLHHDCVPKELQYKLRDDFNQMKTYYPEGLESAVNHILDYIELKGSNLTPNVNNIDMFDTESIFENNDY